MKYFYTILVLTILFFSSCKKESVDAPEKKLDPIDSMASSIIINGFENHDTLRNEVNASVKAKPNLGVEKVEIILNNSVIATSTTENLTLKWSSLTIPDGTYTLKAVAYTKDSKTFETSKEVVIDNALIKLDFQGYISIGLTDIIVTDTKGKILSNIKFPYFGQQNLYSTSYCNEKKINVINVFKSGNIQIIKCDLNIAKGTTWQVKDTPPTGESLYPIKIKLNNIPAFNNINFSTGEMVGGSLSSLADTALAYEYNYYYGASKKLLVQLEHHDKAHYEFFDIANGSTSINADISNLKNESAYKNTMVNGESGRLWISAKLNKDLSGYTRISEKTFYTKNINYFYPDVTVADYTSYIQFINNGWAYNYLYKSLLQKNIEPMDVNASMPSTAINSINCNVNGKFDYFTMTYLSEDYNDLVYFSVTSSTDIKNYKLPDLSSIVAINPVAFNKLKFRDLYIYDLDHFNAKLLPFDSQYSFSDRATNPVKIAQKFTPGFGPNVLGFKSPAGKILKPKY